MNMVSDLIAGFSIYIKFYLQNALVRVSQSGVACMFYLYILGEVYVLDDGGEVDLDLGNYERFLDITLHRDNNITTGKIYQQVIERERRGDYLGKTVQGIYFCILCFQLVLFL